MSKWPCIVGTVLILFCAGRWLFGEPTRWHFAASIAIAVLGSCAWIVGTITVAMKMGWLPSK